MCLQICFESFFVCFSHSKSTSMWCNYVQDVPCSTGIMSDYTVCARCSLKGFYLRHDTLWQKEKMSLVFIKRGIKSLKHKNFCQILFPYYRKYLSLSIEMWNFFPFNFLPAPSTSARTQSTQLATAVPQPFQHWKVEANAARHFRDQDLGEMKEEMTFIRFEVCLRFSLVHSVAWKLAVCFLQWYRRPTWSLLTSPATELAPKGCCGTGTTLGCQGCSTQCLLLDLSSFFFISFISIFINLDNNAT